MVSTIGFDLPPLVIHFKELVFPTDGMVSIHELSAHANYSVIQRITLKLKKQQAKQTCCHYVAYKSVLRQHKLPYETV